MLLNECKKWLLDETVDWYECSDGGYSLTLHKVTDDHFEFTFNGATCYEVDKVHDYDVNFEVDVFNGDNLIVHFSHKCGHGVTHVTSLENFKLFVFDAIN